MNRAAFLRICLAQIRAGNGAWVATLNAQALAKIAAGAGALAFTTSGTLNGKTFARVSQLTSLEVADVTQEAIDETDPDNAGVAATSMDFSEMGL